jgi:hypothetical protein
MIKLSSHTADAVQAAIDIAKNSQVVFIKRRRGWPTSAHDDICDEGGWEGLAAREGRKAGTGGKMWCRCTDQLILLIVADANGLIA